MVRPESGEDGLTLVEMMVAIFVVGLVLMAMASVAFASMRSVQATERVAVATQLGSELLESYLALPYDDLGLYTNDAEPVFPALTFEGETLVLFPDWLVAPDPRLPQAEQSLTQAGTDYTATTAVVWVDDAAEGAQDYKRVIVELRWDVHGEEQSSRVEMLRAPDPTDQPLSVSVSPDVVTLDANGFQQQPVLLTVEAKEPQTTVTVTWVDRDGNQSALTTMAASENGTVWTEQIDGARFANGATLFTVSGTLKGTTQKTVTTLGRGLFLEPLVLASAQTTLDPPVVVYEPGGVYCTESVRITTDAAGAILSDPVTVTLWPPDLADPYIAPLTAETPPLVNGTRFFVDLPVEDLGIVEGTTGVPVRLQAVRPIDPENPVILDLIIPVDSTPAVTPSDDDSTTPDYESCSG